MFYASDYKLIYRSKVLDNQGIILSKGNPIWIGKVILPT